MPHKNSRQKVRDRLRVACETLEQRLLFTTYQVMNTNDSGAGSLRQAITNANNNPGLDTITFQISGSGVHVITPLSPLPYMYDSVIIDGSTQTGYSTTPLIELNGASEGSGVDGLDFNSGSTLNAVAVDYSGGSGVALFGNGNTIENCFLGIDPTGTVAAGNYYDGLYMQSSNNVAANNLISGNGTTNYYAGVSIYTSSATDNLVTGNKIGTDITGTKALGNGGSGIFIGDGAQFNRIGTDGNGVNDAAERNIISANGRGIDYPGIQIDGATTDGNIVAGNYVGTDITGTLALGNGGVGVLISGGQNNRIGVSESDVDAAAERNIISANGMPDFYPGVELYSSNATGNDVAGNFIGTDVSGNLPLGNGGVGVFILNGASNNLIGTNGDGIDDTLERNLIDNSGYQGVAISDVGTSGNVIAGNYIGAALNGAPMGNADNGIWILNGATNNRVGTNDTDADPSGEGNLIVNNGFNGVAINDSSAGDHATGNSIRGNSIYNNGYQGIDDGGDGSNLNHGTVLDPGPNNFQNYPELVSGTPGSSTVVTGTMTSLPNTTDTLDFYASSSAQNPYEGTGARWLGSAVVTTGASGTVSFSATVGTAAADEWITATATDSSGNSSEFSTPIQLPTVPETLNIASWTPIGPAPIVENDTNAPIVSGRVSVAAPDPTNPNVMYIGADGGGVWKTTDWLDPIPTWTPLTDNQPSLSFSNISYTALIVAPSNPQTIYAAVSSPGGGILKSINGGASWVELANNVFDQASFATLVVNPTNANDLFASVWFGATNGGGVYKSTDGGSTWTNTTANVDNGSAADLAMDPSNPSTLYVGLVGGTSNGGANNGIYKTTNGGTTWTLLNNGVLSGSAIGVSIRLAISPSSPQTLYATVFDPALGNAPSGLPHRYKTTNGGASWTPLGDLDDVEPRYWHAVLSVDPTNPNIVYINGDHDLYQSVDGGMTWTLEYNEDPVNVYFDDSGAVIMTGDRGIYRWTGGASAFQNKQGNLQDTEFYNITLDPADPSKVYGIAQDQISNMVTDGSSAWQYTGAGDEVGRVVVDPTNPNVVYEYDPNNDGNPIASDSDEDAGPPDPISFVYRSDDAGSTYTPMGSGIPTSDVGYDLAYAAQRSFEMDPSNHNRLLLGTDTVYETTNDATSWSAVSPQLSPGYFISDVAIAPSNGNVVYAATSDGKLWMTSNDSTWVERDSGLPLLYYNYVVDMQVNPTNANQVFAVVGDFLGGAFGNSHVFETTNGGASWTNITGNMPAEDAGQAIAVDWRFSTPRLYVGTLRGVFVSDNLGTNWEQMNVGLPNADVTDVELAPQFNILAAATYGRGAFEILIPGAISNTITGTPGNDVITLSQSADHQYIDWAMGATTGQILIGDSNGLTINGNGGADTIDLNYAYGNPLPNLLSLNGTFAVNGLSNSNPFAGSLININASQVTINFGTPANDPEAFVRSALASGYNSGGWTGKTGITSTVVEAQAASSKGTTKGVYAIGYSDGNVDGTIGGAMPNDLVISPQLLADANEDGQVNFSDLVTLAQNFGKTGLDWVHSDFNYDSIVNFQDLVQLAQNFGKTNGNTPLSAELPAQASVGLTPARKIAVNPLFSDVPIVATPDEFDPTIDADLLESNGQRVLG